MPERTNEELRAELENLQEQLSTMTAALEADVAASKRSDHRVSLLEATIETVPIGIVFADAKGRIIHGNSHVEKIVRHPVLHSEDVDSYGEWVSYHADGRKVESHEYPLFRVIRDGEARSEIDVHYQRGDGTRFWMRIIGQPVTNAEGELIGATVALIDIDEERKLRDAQEILIAELNHRVKNAFSVVKSIVGQSLRGADVPDHLRGTLDDRLHAYATAHAKLVGTAWDRAPLKEIAADILEPIASDRAWLDGPLVELPSRQGLAFSMAFYELATNALKYGSLSVPGGTVRLEWTVETDEKGDRLIIHWKEQKGPPPVKPAKKGFGSFVISRALAMETGGEVEVNYDADGLSWRIDMPVPENKNGRTS